MTVDGNSAEPIQPPSFVRGWTVHVRFLGDLITVLFRIKDYQY